MCGIVGLISANATENFSRSVDAIAHRGPDFGSFEEIFFKRRRILLGHRRLSIVDLSSGANQPFSTACGNYTIIYNGEVYNHQELREELKQHGAVFRTRSDTEVILTALSLWGKAALPKLNGMFAFAFVDRAKGKMYLARDPFGIKPLYLNTRADGSIAFASELRAIAALSDNKLAPDPDALAEFLLNGFLYEPNTGFSGVTKIAPGHGLEIDLASMSCSGFQYHNPLAYTKQVEEFGEALTDQVALELEADVNTGLFFSGGVDSSVLAAATTRNIQAMYVEYGQEGAGDAPYVDAMASALNLNLQRVRLSEKEMTAQAILDEFNEVARGTEEPISDYTYIATRAISREARKAGFKVMLSGMGGDELFAGYPRHVLANHWNALRKVGPAAHLLAGVLQRFPSWQKRSGRLAAFLSADDFIEAYTSLVGYYSAREVEHLLGQRRGIELFRERAQKLLDQVSGASPLRQAMYLDRNGFLAHNLTVTDKASMAESIEVRVPLLNARIEAFAASLPDSDLLKGRAGKLPLKQFLALRSPKDLVNRPKAGFNPPLDGRIARLGKGFCKEVICSDRMAMHLDISLLSKMVDEHFDGRKNNTYRIWQMIYLSLWLNQYS